MRQFSDPHLAALAVLVLSVAGAIHIGRHHPGRPTDVLAYGLAALILAAWAGEYIVDIARGVWTVQYDLPLQLTDTISVTAAVALITRRQALAELTYLWALSASLQATLTPDLAQNFPSVYYFTYFVYHIGAIVAGCLLVFGCGAYPRRHAAWRTFGFTALWAAVAGAADAITGGNYGYLHWKPAHNSLMSLMGRWPIYVAETGLVGLAMLLIIQWVTDWIRRHDRGRSRPAVAAGATTPG